MPPDAWGAGEILDLLVSKQKKGVRVKVGVDESYGKVKAHTYLKQNGVNARVYSSNRTQHIKAIVVDKTYAFVGSQNISTPALAGKNWESGVIFKSKRIAKKLTKYLQNQH